MDNEPKEKTQRLRNKSVVRGTNAARKRKITSAIVASTASTAKRSKRTHKKPDRYGKRLSASDRDAFFEQISSNTDSDGTTDGLIKTPDTIHSIDSGESSSDLEIVDSGSSSRETVSSIANERTALHAMNHVHTTPIEEINGQTPIQRILRSDEYTSRPESNDRAILTKLDEILMRISCIEKNTAKIEVRLRNLEQNSTRVDIVGDERESDNESDAMQLELPVKNKESLDKLEANLNLQDFRRKMVTLLPILNIFQNISAIVFAKILNSYEITSPHFENESDRIFIY